MIWDSDRLTRLAAEPAHHVAELVRGDELLLDEELFRACHGTGLCAKT